MAPFSYLPSFSSPFASSINTSTSHSFFLYSCFFLSLFPPNVFCTFFSLSFFCRLVFFYYYYFLLSCVFQNPTSGTGVKNSWHSSLNELSLMDYIYLWQTSPGFRREYRVVNATTPVVICTRYVGKHSRSDLSAAKLCLPVESNIRQARGKPFS